MTPQDLMSKYNKQAGAAPTTPTSTYKPLGGVRGFALDIIPFGRIAEKAISGNASQITPGETALEAALSILPLAGKVIKGGVKAVAGAVKGAEAAGAATKAATAVTKTATAAEKAAAVSAADAAKAVKVANAINEAQKLNMAQRIGSRMTQAGAGIKLTPEVGNVAKATSQAKIAAKYTGTPRTALSKLSNDMTLKSDQVDSILTGSKYVVKPSHFTKVAGDLVKDPLRMTNVDLTERAVKSAFDSHVSKMRTFIDPKSLNDYIKTLNPVAIRAQDKISRGLVPTAKEQAALAAKQVGDEIVSTAVPAVKGLKREMAQLFELNPQLTRAAEKNMYVPLLGMQVPGVAQGIRGALSRTGGVVSKAGDITAGLKPAQKYLLQQAGIRLPFAILEPGGAQATPQETAAATAAGVGGDQLQNLLNQIASGQATGANAPQPTVDDILPIQNLQIAMARDPKNAMKYLQAYTALSKIVGDRLTKNATQQKQLMGTQAATGLVDQIEQTVGEIGASGRIGGGVAKLQGALGLNARANAYEQSRPSLSLMLIKAIQGSAGNISDADRAAIENAIPSVMDTEQERQLKIQSLRGVINTYSQAAGGPSSTSSGSTALQDALSAMGY